jgi:glycerol-3-phosphate dehydrogenase
LGCLSKYQEDNMQNKYDIIIIGSGITGSLIARYLSRYELSVLVLEKEIDVGMNPSSANSAIIHGGYDPKPGTLKSKMNAEGNNIWHSLATELGIVHRDTGSMVVAITPGEEPTLKELLERGKQAGVQGMKIVGHGEVVDLEPLINPQVLSALWCPTAAVIDPFGAVLAAAENAVVNGVTYSFETSFEDFIFEGKNIIGIKTNRGDFMCKWAINCAGLYSDEVSHKAGVRNDFKILPRKGGYLVFDPMKVKISNVLFPVPSTIGKGTLVSTTTHGNTLAGPDNDPCDGKEDASMTKESMEKILNDAKRLVPSLTVSNVIAIYSGIRATGSGDRDFIIEIPKEVNGFVNLCGIESPGFASAPAIALHVIDMIKDKGLKMKEKPQWNPVRKPFPHIHMMSNKEKAELIRKNPSYGRVVCRCEEVSEGEVLDALRSPVPARTYDGIKRRTWLGTGRCQGAFDYPRVIEIISRELGIPVTEVSKKGKGSEFVFRRTKDI